MYHRLHQQYQLLTVPPPQVDTLPIPDSLSSIIDGIAQAVVAPVSSILSTGQLTQFSSVLNLLNLFSSLNIGDLGALSSLTNLPGIQTAASGLNTQDLLSVLEILSSLPGGLDLTTLLSDPTSLLTLLETIVPNVQDPVSSAAFVLLGALNLGNLGELTSSLSGAASGSGTAGLTSALGGLTAGLGAGIGASASR